MFLEHHVSWRNLKKSLFQRKVLQIKHSDKAGFKMKSILVAGGSGFIGTSLAVALKRHFGCDVICLAESADVSLPLYERTLADAGIMLLDEIPDADSDLRFSTVVDCFCHVFRNEVPDAELISSRAGVLSALAEKIICLSSRDVYSPDALSKCAYSEFETRFMLEDGQTEKGVSSAGITEEFTVSGHVHSVRGMTALALENSISEACLGRGIPYVIDRIGTVAGAGQSAHPSEGFFPLWIAAHLRELHIRYRGVGGFGKQVRDVMDIADLSRLIACQIKDIGIFAAEPVFNVGGGMNSSISLLELTTVCESATGKTTKITADKRTSETDVPVYVSDISKLRNTGEWAPEISIESMVCGMVIRFLDDPELLDFS